MQDVAWKHAKALQFGYSDLGSRNQFWALSRITMQVTGYPRWGDTVRLESWTSGTNRLFALRDFRLYDDEERELMKAVTAWLVVDSESRRPVRPETVLQDLVVTSLPSQFQDPPEKITPPDTDHGAGVSYETTARYSDIDAQSHVNNTRYVSWMLDSLGPSWHESRHLHQLSVNFLKECVLNDVLDVSCTVSEDQTRSDHAITRIDDGTRAAVMSLRWRS